jgi:hypothetical protein
VRLLKIVGFAALGLVLALAAGWIWGSAGKSELSSELEALRLEHDVTLARSSMLAARVDLYTLNYGSATQHCESAKGALSRLAARFDRDDDKARAALVRTALSAAEEARRLAGQVNPSAQTAAQRALASLDQVASPPGK